MSDRYRAQTDEDKQAAHPLGVDHDPRLGDSWMPLGIRYGSRKISDWTRKTEDYPATPGRLWDLLEVSDGQ